MYADEKAQRKVSLALIWHFHQPDYRDPTGVGDMVLPWVRLHCCRAYTDMAWLLERHPQVRATVSISPVLADQIDDLAHGRCGDRFLDLSLRAAEELSSMDRIEILRGFFMIDWERSIRPIPRYWYLLHKRGRDLKTIDLERVAGRFTEGEMRDLQVLFNLAWMGSMARNTQPVVQNLLNKGHDFTEIEKRVLLDAQEKLISQVLPRWRALAARGQIELCTTPYYHPILPLLIDTDSARESMPGASLPPRIQRPADARQQIERAIEGHRRHFGTPPSGLWPSEGAVSQETAEMIANSRVSWIASDEMVLRRSETNNGERPSENAHYQPWRVVSDDHEVAVFFRDRILSDLVAFSYSSNPPSEAVADLMTRLARIGGMSLEARDGGPSDGALVTIVLDGENPWEQYLDSGRPFLEALYRALSTPLHDGVVIETTTPSQWLSKECSYQTISRLHGGSWVDGSLRVWIGHPETNQAWSLIGSAGQVLDTLGQDLAPENREEALDHLFVAQGSDWSWWYGDDFITETPEAFDALFRARLLKIYELTGEATPPKLRRPISPAAAKGQSIVLLREPWSLITPVINGRAAPYVDWQGAGVYRPGQHMGRMYRSTSLIEALHYGCDPTELYLRLDISKPPGGAESLGELMLQLLASDREIDIMMPLRHGSSDCQAVSHVEGGKNLRLGRICFGDIVEIAIPFEPLDLPGGETLLIAVRLLIGGVEIERIPRYGHLKVRVPRGDLHMSDWQA